MGKKKSKARGAPSSSASGGAAAISAADFMNACRAGKFVKLRRWGRQGLRVMSAVPLFYAVEEGNLDLMRCLVDDLGADVNQAYSLVADVNQAHSLGADVNQAHSLGADVNQAHSLGADVNQAYPEGATLLTVAAENTHLHIVRCRR
jgi:hypothetical protein